MNKDNLKRMADYIITIPQKKFNMRFFRRGNIKNIECNSVGCVIGHCTILDSENILINYRDIFNEIDFIGWSYKFTGLNRYEWHWCFASDWINIDNTPEGASQRIMYLIENGLPDNWIEQMDGKKPLCYK